MTDIVKSQPRTQVRVLGEDATGGGSFVSRVLPKHPCALARVKMEMVCLFILDKLIIFFYKKALGF